MTLKPGEMSLHDVNIIHGSEANCSNTCRIGFPSLTSHQSRAPRFFLSCMRVAALIIRIFRRWREHLIMKWTGELQLTRNLSSAARCSFPKLDNNNGTKRNERPSCGFALGQYVHYVFFSCNSLVTTARTFSAHSLEILERNHIVGSAFQLACWTSRPHCFGTLCRVSGCGNGKWDRSRIYENHRLRISRRGPRFSRRGADDS